MGLTVERWDNAMAESFFATLKTEFYYRRVWPTKTTALTGPSSLGCIDGAYPSAR